MSIIGFFYQNPGHMLIGLLIGSLSIIGYYILNFYDNRKNYPPGPFPLPFLGNVLKLKSKKHLHNILEDIGKNYKDGVFTFYFGNNPQVIVVNPHLGLQVLKKHEFAGRPEMPMAEMFNLPDSVDVLFSDFNKEWQVLRKVSHAAVRKYAVSQKLTHTAADVVDEVIAKIFKNEGIGKEIDIKPYLFESVNCIIASSAFGKQYTPDDSDVKMWIHTIEVQFRRATEIILMNFVPLLKYVFWGAMKEFKESIKFQHRFLHKNYDEHVKDFDGQNVRDFTDALLMARKDAEADEESHVLKYLKPYNIQTSVKGLYVAAIESTRSTLSWVFLLLANYPDKQQKVRVEVNEFILGDDIPNLGHKANCNYTAAFIAETMRFRYIVALGFPHKTTIDMKLGSYFIKKDTTILSLVNPMMHDKETWGDPEVFRPERFLDENGRFLPRPNALYIPFSAGKRSCPGEKLALANIFFFIVRFFQKTQGYEFVLPGGPGSIDLTGDPMDPSAWNPYPYHIIFKRSKP